MLMPFFLFFLGFWLSLKVEYNDKYFLDRYSYVMALWNNINAIFFYFLGFQHEIWW
jgi:hypothetical protein